MCKDRVQDMNQKALLYMELERLKKQVAGGSGSFIPLTPGTHLEDVDFQTAKKKAEARVIEAHLIRRRNPGFFLEPGRFFRYFLELEPRPSNLVYDAPGFLRFLNSFKLKDLRSKEKRSDLSREVAGNLAHVIRGYGRCVAHKIYLLGLLTVGAWTQELFDTMEIDALAKRFESIRSNSPSGGDDIATVPIHQEVMKQVGLAHSLFWQFIPGCVFVAKLGEACCATPCFIWASQARVKDDVQDRVDFFVLSIMEFLATFAFACRPKMYWLWVSGLCILLHGIKTVEQSVYDLGIFDSVFHGCFFAKGVSWLTGTPLRPKIIFVEQIGFWAHIRFQLPKCERFSPSPTVLSRTDRLLLDLPQVEPAWHFERQHQQ